MRQIKLNTQKIVRKNLVDYRKKNLKESFSSIKNIKHEEDLLPELVSISVKLLEEGYTTDEIGEQISNLDEEGELINIKGLPDLTTGVDWKKLGQDTLINSAKEYGIKFLLRFLGMGEEWSTTLAQLFADLNPLDLIRVFKDRASCNQHAKHITDAVMKVIIRAVASNVTGGNRNSYDWGDIGNVGLGNVVGQAIEQSNLGEKTGEILCNLIHK